ncbi:hypothetical protein N9W34_02850 [Rickettsiales bacterium]|nr:hypothetical protein [Rickettsiales bacterium]
MTKERLLNSQESIAKRLRKEIEYIKTYELPYDQSGAEESIAKDFIEESYLLLNIINEMVNLQSNIEEYYSYKNKAYEAKYKGYSNPATKRIAKNIEKIKEYKAKFYSQDSDVNLNSYFFGCVEFDIKEQLAKDPKGTTSLLINKLDSAIKVRKNDLEEYKKYYEEMESKANIELNPEYTYYKSLISLRERKEKLKEKQELLERAEKAEIEAEKDVRKAQTGKYNAESKLQIAQKQQIEALKDELKEIKSNNDYNQANKESDQKKIEKETAQKDLEAAEKLLQNSKDILNAKKAEKETAQQDLEAAKKAETLAGKISEEAKIELIKMDEKEENSKKPPRFTRFADSAFSAFSAFKLFARNGKTPLAENSKIDIKPRPESASSQFSDDDYLGEPENTPESYIKEDRSSKGQNQSNETAGIGTIRKSKSESELSNLTAKEEKQENKGLRPSASEGNIAISHRERHKYIKDREYIKNKAADIFKAADEEPIKQRRQSIESSSSAPSFTKRLSSSFTRLTSGIGGRGAR